MPTGFHTLEVDVNIKDIWSFIHEIDNWAHLSPGYVSHEKIDDKRMMWTLDADIGIMQKRVKIETKVLLRKEPNKIKYEFNSLTDNFSGNGIFHMEEITDNKTKIITNVHFQAKGVMGPMINSIVQTILPKYAEEATEKVVKIIKEEISKTK